MVMGAAGSRRRARMFKIASAEWTPGPSVSCQAALDRGQISPHEQHARVAEPDVGDLDDHRRAVDQHDLVLSVELVGLTRRKRQRDIGDGRSLRPSAPAMGVAAQRVVPALVPERAEGLEHPDQGQPLWTSPERSTWRRPSSPNHPLQNQSR